MPRGGPLYSPTIWTSEAATHADGRERLIEAFYRIVREIHTEGDLPELLHAILRESRDLIGCRASSLFLYDEERQDLAFAVVVGGDESLRSVRVPVGEGIVGAAARDRKTVVVADAASDTRHLALGSFEIRNLVAVPMVKSDRLVGVIEVLDKEGGFDEADVKILEILAEQAAVQVEHTRLIREQIVADRRASLGTAAAGIAHYLKNVLTQWKGSAGLVDHGLENGDLDLVRRAWPVMRRTHQRIGVLVEDMLSLSKPREPERDAIDLNEAVAQVLEAEGDRAVSLGVVLLPDLDPDLPIGRLEPRRIHELLVNLVSNALDAHEDAGTAGAWVRVTTRGRGERVEIAVADNGPGMPPHVEGRIFEPFFSTKGRKGTGLGLALAAKTIEEHRGTVQVRTRPGEGTTVRIDLPLS